MSTAKKKILIASVVLLVLLFLAKNTQALTVDSQGNVNVEVKEGEVLSRGSDDDDNNDKDDKSGSSKSSGSSGSGSSGSDAGKTGNETQKTETTTPGGTTIKTEIKDGEVRTETRLPTGVKIKTREEEGRTRTDIYQGGTKLRIERREDRTVIKLEGEEGEGTEIPAGDDEEIFKIEERTDKGQIRVFAAGEKFVLSQNQIGATTSFPLSVNLETNELTVTTPAGERVVTVLPSQAVQNMLAANVIDQVKGLAFTQDVAKIATQSGTQLSEVISLTTTREGVLAYEIQGISSQRLLGFIPVSINKTVVASAETGELITVQQPILSTILDLVSF